MTLIDSLDSLVMLYSYAGFPEQSFAVFERRVPSALPQAAPDGIAIASASAPPRLAPSTESEASEGANGNKKMMGGTETVKVDDQIEERRTLTVKNNAMSNLSILLTIMSILVAFRYVYFGHILCSSTGTNITTAYL